MAGSSGQNISRNGNVTITATAAAGASGSRPFGTSDRPCRPSINSRSPSRQQPLDKRVAVSRQQVDAEVNRQATAHVVQSEAAQRMIGEEVPRRIQQQQHAMAPPRQPQL